MELWIRSQDRERMFKTESLYISGENDEYYVGDSFVGHIGIYNTKERALEVLDEIQDVIYMKQLFNADADRFATCLEEDMNMSEEDMNLLVKQISVYKMPKE